MESKIFNGGTPTDMDVRNLMNRWPETNMRSGDKFSHVEIESVLKVGKDSLRYTTITNRWRKIVEKTTG